MQAGEKTVGTAQYLVYTEEQQARLNVDAYGETPGETPDSSAASSPTKELEDVAAAVTSPQDKPLLVCGGGDLRPAWMRNGLAEAPAGRKSMGTWEAAVYTSEQQTRLGVDESGNLKTPGTFSGTFSFSP